MKQIADHIKKAACAAVVLCSIILFPAQPVMADLIAEPMGISDQFYVRHQDACLEEINYYSANGQDGYTYVYESPVSTTRNASLANGVTFSTICTYSSSISSTWALVDVIYSTYDGAVTSYDRTSEKGWVKVSDCQPTDAATAAANANNQTDSMIQDTADDSVSIVLILLIALSSLSVTAITAILIHVIFKMNAKKKNTDTSSKSE